MKAVFTTNLMIIFDEKCKQEVRRYYELIDGNYILSMITISGKHAMINNNYYFPAGSSNKINRDITEEQYWKLYNKLTILI